MSEISNEELFENPEEQQAYEDFCANQEANPEFQLDKPALICRWRMANRHLPMINRHIRALSQRLVSGAPLSKNMLSWAKQHVEWSLCEGTYSDPNGVLMMVVDVNGNSAMTVGDFTPLEQTTLAALLERAEESRKEQAITRVAPELLCAVRSDDTVVIAAEKDEYLCGSATLITQLLEAKHAQVVYDVELLAELEQGAERVHDAYTEAFMISDEFGVVSADGMNGSVGEFLQAGYERLRMKTR